MELIPAQWSLNVYSDQKKKLQAFTFSVSLCLSRFYKVFNIFLQMFVLRISIILKIASG